MARRRAGKADTRSLGPKSPAPRGGGRRSGTSSGTRLASSDSASEATLGERLGALERECAALRVELERERSRRKTLEEVHAATRDRIAWALDSLQAILEVRG